MNSRLETRNLNLSLGRKRAQAAQNLLPLRIGWGEGWGEVLVILLLLLLSSSVPAATFTNNLPLSETNTAYDGQAIVISGAARRYSALSHAVLMASKCPSQCSSSTP